MSAHKQNTFPLSLNQAICALSLEKHPSREAIKMEQFCPLYVWRKTNNVYILSPSLATSNLKLIHHSYAKQKILKRSSAHANQLTFVFVTQGQGRLYSTDDESYEGGPERTRD